MEPHDTRPTRVAIFGASPGTGNLGVSALGLSLVAGIAQRAPAPEITLFDDGCGVRSARTHVGARSIGYRLCGAVPTRRLYRRDSLWRIHAAARHGSGGGAALDILRAADAILDITGGDSFTDLYGPRRFNWTMTQKRIALDLGKPLILPPQTIGPFRRPASRRRAAEILRAAAMVWARDETSFALLRDLVGSDFDPEHHRHGVDVAFGLAASAPDHAVPGEIEAWWSEIDRPPLVGLNVSGLIANDAGGARRRFGLRSDYGAVVRILVRRMLDETDAHILLVPHVITQAGHLEHDLDAIASVLAELDPGARRRVATAPAGLGPAEMKWIIARTDWFCGARMHATIAALSSGVPTAAAAYSGKAAGVFATCGQATHVADLRELDTSAAVDHLWSSWLARTGARAALAARLPGVLARAGAQMDAIVDRIRPRPGTPAAPTEALQPVHA